MSMTLEELQAHNKELAERTIPFAIWAPDLREHYFMPLESKSGLKSAVKVTLAMLWGARPEGKGINGYPSQEQAFCGGAQESFNPKNVKAFMTEIVEQAGGNKFARALAKGWAKAERLYGNHPSGLMIFDSGKYFCQRFVVIRQSEKALYEKISIAQSPETSAEVLVALAGDGSFTAKCWIAANPNTPAEMLELMAHSRDVNVRYWVAENPSACINTVHYLTHDEDDFVSSEAEKAFENRGGVCHDVA